MDKKNIKYVLFFLIIAFFLLVFSVIFALLNINNTNILNGISINGIDVSGMSKESATSSLNDIISLKSNDIKIMADGYETTVNFDYLDINYDITKAINEAYNIGRLGNIFQNNFQILDAFFNKKNINVDIKINNDNLEKLTNDINANLPNKLVQSSYYIDENNLIITKGSSGDVIDRSDFENKFYMCLNDLCSIDNFIYLQLKNSSPNEINIDEIYNNVYKDVKNAYYEENPFKVYPEVIGVSFNKETAKNLLLNEQDEYVVGLSFTYPQVTIHDLDVNIFRNTLGYFTTLYDISNKNRTTNLELAASKINGFVLAPGDEFSYNSIVGARTISDGYKEAAIYSDGKVVDGLGGGICQVSSTLYNAAILANLNITERHNHMFLTSYVPAGRDATVVYGVKDLKFVNNRSFPIKIDFKVRNGVAYCSIYGIEESTEYDIDFDVETLSLSEPPTKYEYDSSLDYNSSSIKQSGSNATSVNVYKVVKLNGSVVSKTLISHDTYDALDKIILTGKNEFN